MAVETVLAQLRSAGTQQNRKVYARHGVGANQFGVSFAHLNRLAKEWRRHPELAGPLWETGNHDARMLATQIADPTALSAGWLDAAVNPTSAVGAAFVT